MLDVERRLATAHRELQMQFVREHLLGFVGRFEATNIITSDNSRHWVHAQRLGLAQRFMTRKVLVRETEEVGG